LRDESPIGKNGKNKGIKTNLGRKSDRFVVEEMSVSCRIDLFTYVKRTFHSRDPIVSHG